MVTVTTSATWQPEPRGRVFDDMRGSGTDRIAWGAPDAENRETGYTFTGHTTEARLDGHDFTVGTITYDNYLREPAGSGRFHSCAMNVTVRLSVQDGPETEFPLAFSHLSYGDEDRDVPDILRIPVPLPGEQTLTVDGVPYTLIITGFPGVDDGPLQQTQSGPEGQTTTTDVLGMLVRTDKPDIAIRSVHHQGESGRPQDGEYIELVNRSAAMIPLQGWTINAGDAGQDFTFPATGYFAPGMALRVYTSGQQQPAGWYGLTFHSERPIWNDKGDVAELRDKSGNLRARYAYGNAAD